MRIQKLTWMAMLVAIAVAGSLFISIPTGVARAYPIQHMVNVIAAVTVGPFGAVLVAFVTGLVRVVTGTGSLLAFPGGMIGALLAGLFYAKSHRISFAAFGEVIGTGVIASLIAVPYAKLLMGSEFGAFFFFPAFLLSSSIGALLGCIVLTRIKQLQPSIPKNKSI